MDADLLAVLAFIALFALIALRVPVGIALSAVGVVGFGVLAGSGPAFKLLALSPLRTASDFNFAVVPLFVAMGVIARESGISTDLFRACNAWLGHLRGGTALATVAACGGFSAICGSSVATAATMAKIAMPEMRRYGYSDGFAAGVIAAGGTLGILIPPSMALIVYGILTEQDIGKLFIAGVLPGILALSLYMLAVYWIGAARPSLLPGGQKYSWGERFVALRGVWSATLIFLFIIGGIYGGLFTALEAAGVGATATLLVAIARRSLSWDRFVASFVESVRVTGSLFLILIGAILFGNFLVITGAPQKITALLTELPIGPYGVMVMILVFYMILGCVLDSLAMIIVTVPIVYPAVVQLGFDPIWFGVMIVMVCELGLITPPYGMNVFVINAVMRDVSVIQIFRGVVPFIAVDIVRIGLVLVFPAIATFLPRTMG